MKEVDANHDRNDDDIGPIMLKVSNTSSIINSSQAVKLTLLTQLCNFS